jgi:Leucine-rich repeat (LRR) protein
MELQTLLGQRWQSQWQGLLAGPPQFRNGIPDTVAVHAAVFLQRGSELFARWPIRRLRVVDPAPCWSALWKSPLLAHIRELDLCDSNLAQLDLLPLCRCPYLRNLQILDLSFNQLTDAALAPLQRHWPFPHLRVLALNDNRLTGQAASLLALDNGREHLEMLDLSRNEIAPEALAALCLRPWPRLRVLELSGNPLGDTGLTLFVNTVVFQRMMTTHGVLEWRGHPHMRVTATGLQALLASSAVSHLRVLNLADQDLGDEGLVTLLQQNCSPQLRQLILSRNGITDRGIRRTRQHWPAWLTQLRFVDLSGNHLSRYGVALLTAALPPEGGAAIDIGTKLSQRSRNSQTEQTDELEDLHSLRQRAIRPHRRSL